MSLTTNIFIERAKKVHGDKYDYDLVNYIHSNKKVKILCNKCKNFFEQLPYNHCGGKRGCPICYRDKSKEVQKLTLNEFIEKCKKIHKNRYDYSLVKYTNNRVKVDIKCNKCKKFFKQRAFNHLAGNGCPNCWYKNYTSKPEKEFLDVVGVKVRQKKIGGYLVDGIKNKTIYEFLGDFWHGIRKNLNLLM